MGADQFYFSKEKLRALLELFDSPDFQKKMGDREFKGLVITPGKTDDGTTAAFGFGVFGKSSMNTTTEESDTVIYPSTDPRYKGCPWPPGCP